MITRARNPSSSELPFWQLISLSAFSHKSFCEGLRFSSMSGIEQPNIEVLSRAVRNCAARQHCMALDCLAPVLFPQDSSFPSNPVQRPPSVHPREKAADDIRSSITGAFAIVTTINCSPWPKACRLSSMRVPANAEDFWIRRLSIRMSRAGSESNVVQREKVENIQ